MGSHQYFCLRWNNHQNNMLHVFDQLLHNEAFVDVTLACDGVSLKAHKMVLSACSPYFQTLFMDNPCTHPIVILKDIAYNDMKALVDFMYKGEVNVTQDQLGDLLKTAECLKVKGLAEVASCAINSQNANLNTPLQNASALVQPISVSSPIETIVIPPSPVPIPIPVLVTPPIPPTISPIPASEPSRTVTMTPRSTSPPNKRKRMPPRRRSVEISHSDAENDSDSILIDNSPLNLVEAKVEVMQDNYSDKQSDGVADRHSDVDIDSSQEGTNMVFRPGENESFNSNSSNQSLTRHHLPLSLISSSIPSTSRTPVGNQGVDRLGELLVATAEGRDYSMGHSGSSSGPVSPGMGMYPAMGAAMSLMAMTGQGYKYDSMHGHAPKRGQPRILGEDEEGMIVNYIMEIAAKGRPVTRKSVLEYGNMLLRRGDRVPTGSIHCNPDKGLSNDWWKEFKKRHPTLPFRVPVIRDYDSSLDAKLQDTGTDRFPVIRDYDSSLEAAKFQDTGTDR